MTGSSPELIALSCAFRSSALGCGQAGHRDSQGWNSPQGALHRPMASLSCRMGSSQQCRLERSAAPLLSRLIVNKIFTLSPPLPLPGHHGHFRHLSPLRQGAGAMGGREEAQDDVPVVSILSLLTKRHRGGCFPGPWTSVRVAWRWQSGLPALVFTGFRGVPALGLVCSAAS